MSTTGTIVRLPSSSPNKNSYSSFVKSNRLTCADQPQMHCLAVETNFFDSGLFPKMPESEILDCSTGCGKTSNTQYEIQSTPIVIWCKQANMHRNPRCFCRLSLFVCAIRLCAKSCLNLCQVKPQIAIRWNPASISSGVSCMGTGLGVAHMQLAATTLAPLPNVLQAWHTAR